MLFILHGENAIKSRDIVLQLQQKLGIDSRKEFSIDDISPNFLKTELYSFDMFGNPPLIILDVSTTRKRKLDDYFAVLQAGPKDAAIVIFSSEKLSNANVFIKQAKSLKAKIVCSAEAPNSNVFKFLDAVFSGNRAASYKELEQLLLAREDPFKLFSMLCYGLRNIAYAKFDSARFGKFAPFMKGKLVKQAANFSENSLLEIYENLYKMDVAMKTGRVPSSLAVPVSMEKILCLSQKST